MTTDPATLRALAEAAIETDDPYYMTEMDPKEILALLDRADRAEAVAVAQLHPDDGHEHAYACLRCGVDNGINEVNARAERAEALAEHNAGLLAVWHIRAERAEAVVAADAELLEAVRRWCYVHEDDPHLDPASIRLVAAWRDKPAAVDAYEEAEERRNAFGDLRAVLDAHRFLRVHRSGIEECLCGWIGQGWGDHREAAVRAALAAAEPTWPSPQDEVAVEALNRAASEAGRRHPDDAGFGVDILAALGAATDAEAGQSGS